MWAPVFDFYLDRCKGISQAKVCNLAFELDVVDREKHSSVWISIRKAIRQAHLEVREKWGENLRLSIIDKDVHWYRDDSTVNVTYADSDNEYTIVSWENLCYCDQTALGTGAHALRKYIRPSYEDSADFYRLMEETVKVLVRRDNEVSCPFKGHACRPEGEEEEEERRNRELESWPIFSWRIPPPPPVVLPVQKLSPSLLPRLARISRKIEYVDLGSVYVQIRTAVYSNQHSYLSYYILGHLMQVQGDIVARHMWLW
jgi:hypothetical protein